MTCLRHFAGRCIPSSAARDVDASSSSASSPSAIRSNPGHPAGRPGGDRAGDGAARPRQAALAAIPASSWQCGAHGDLGNSFVFNEPALRLILERLPATLELAVAREPHRHRHRHSARPLAGLKPHSLAGKAITAGSILGFSLPTFWVGLVLIMVFAVALGWLPATGRGRDGASARGRDQPPDARRAAPSRAAGARPRALRDGAGHSPDPRRHARGHAARLIKFARAKGLSPRRIVSSTSSRTSSSRS